MGNYRITVKAHGDISTVRVYVRLVSCVETALLSNGFHQSVIQSFPCLFTIKLFEFYMIVTIFNI